MLLFTLIFATLSSFGQQTIYDTIIHDNIQRSFITYVPESYNPDVASPLIINFHGYTSNAFQQMFYGDFRDIADTAGFLLVHPNGTLDPQGNTYWNANWGGTVDDIGFTEALIDSLSAEYLVDPERVYCTGMSNGGFMSYVLACELSHRIAAIASVTGTMNLNPAATCFPQHPMPIMEIHGTGDFVVPYNGNGFMESIENTLDYWVNFNQTNTEAILTLVPDIDPNDGCTAEHYQYINGENGVVVEHYKIIDGGHTWPGSPFPSGNGNTNMDIDASSEIWKFFAQFDINGKIETTALDSKKDDLHELRIYPNPATEVISAHFQKDVVRLKLLNVDGVEMFNLDVSDESVQIISVANYPTGIYVLQSFGVDGQLIGTRKLMIQ